MVNWKCIASALLAIQLLITTETTAENDVQFLR